MSFWSILLCWKFQFWKQKFQNHQAKDLVKFWFLDWFCIAAWMWFSSFESLYKKWEFTQNFNFIMNLSWQHCKKRRRERLHSRLLRHSPKFAIILAKFEPAGTFPIYNSDKRQYFYVKNSTSYLNDHKCYFRHLL